MRTPFVVACCGWCEGARSLEYRALLWGHVRRQWGFSTGEGECKTHVPHTESALEGFFTLQERNHVYVYLQFRLYAHTRFAIYSPCPASSLLYPPPYTPTTNIAIYIATALLFLSCTRIVQRGRSLRIERTPYMGRGHLTENLGYESPGPSINLKGTFADDQCGVQAKPALRPPSATFAKCRRF